MAQHLTRMNSKAKKNFLKMLQEQYGYQGQLDDELFIHERKQKIYLFTKDILGIDYSALRVDAMGMYIGAIYEGKFRFTIEGSQLFGKECTQNILSISKDQFQEWIQGMKLDAVAFSDLPEEGSFVLIRHEQDFIGSGKVSRGAITNYIPKTRYVHALYE